MGRHCHHKWTGLSSLTNTSIKCSYSNNRGTKSEQCHPLPFSLAFTRHESVSRCVVTRNAVKEKVILTKLCHQRGIHHTSKHGCQRVYPSFSDSCCLDNVGIFHSLQKSVTFFIIMYCFWFHSTKMLTLLLKKVTQSFCGTETWKLCFRWDTTRALGG